MGGGEGGRGYTCVGDKGGGGKLRSGKCVMGDGIFVGPCTAIGLVFWRGDRPG